MNLQCLSLSIWLFVFTLLCSFVVALVDDDDDDAVGVAVDACKFVWPNDVS